MKVLRVNLDEKSYDIVIQKDLKDYFGEYIKTVFDGKKVAIITDNNLNDIYGDSIKTNIENEGLEVKIISVKPGEKSKSFDTLPGIYNELLDFKLTRSDLIIALGGGVVGDLAGFVAATFLRGIDFIQIPTSLLAQVDSSVGGKVAVDLERGKNLVGSFYHPKLVLIDPNMLGTLPEKYFNDGLGEVIKYGCIKSKELFEKLEGFENKEDLKENIGDIIYECCNIKREVVENDEKDLGERMVLNFGHTLGHAIEQIYNYETYSHGEAVAIGMNMISKIAEEKELTKKGTAERIEKLLKKYGLSTDVNIEDNGLAREAIKLDKKNLNGSLKVILLKDIGESYIYNTNIKFFE
ncbi:3-dehydroquinate synthase [Clostridium perfringens]|nr:3-dehydroquinate synthase [Clostridium perfringens]